MFRCPQDSAFVTGGEIPAQLVGQFPELFAVQQLSDVHGVFESEFRNDFGDASH